MIENAKYTITGWIAAEIDGQEMTVPDDMANRHRIMLAEWEAEGNTIEPYIPEPVIEPIPDEISRRQFFQQLANMEIITRDDALAALTSGAIPAPLQTIINGLPSDDDKFNAQMLVIGAQTFNRTHPLAEIVRQAMQWTVEQKDNFWRDAAKL
ncbi:hypothetical protein KQ944_18050 [Bacillus subtilis]|uniref:hypothetical protein n=1 Tax=Pseudochrobactrum asaccharolyticum TaxID=354351 RepID=UPI001F2CB011|nr:hypothetical protein [Pseudochrobactrum asaccharolyticum]MCF7646900.1 hypothetical protein [Pseudochrobactrum asaccharolyticum]MCF7673542.1 hypothetical protein [Bacillus subtilis]